VTPFCSASAIKFLVVWRVFVDHVLAKLLNICRFGFRNGKVALLNLCQASDRSLLNEGLIVGGQRGCGPRGIEREQSQNGSCEAVRLAVAIEKQRLINPKTSSSNNFRDPKWSIIRAACDVIMCGCRAGLFCEPVSVRTVVMWKWSDWFARTNELAESRRLT
jgi:hypothetical protein